MEILREPTIHCATSTCHSDPLHPPATRRVAATAGGGLFAGSNSSFTYISTAEYPKTFVLVNTKTGENIFEMDIPVGKGLVVKFLQGQGDEPAATLIDEVRRLFRQDMNGMLSPSMTVPGPTPDGSIYSSPRAKPTPHG